MEDFTVGETREECRDFKRNVCTKGDRCKYYHPTKDANSIFERNSVCHDFQNPKGCQRESCKFLHLSKEQEDYIRANGTCPPSLSQQEMDKILGLPPFCNDFMRGTCNRGNNCKFRHVGDPGPGLRPGPRGGGGGGGGGGPERFDPYRRPSEDAYGRMEMKRRYREDMMEDEIMYLRAQVSRLKRSVADLAATNESLMDENARYRVDRSRAGPAAGTIPPSGYDPAARLAAAVPPRASDYGMAQARSAYPYSSGLKLEPAASLASVAPMPYNAAAPY